MQIAVEHLMPALDRLLQERTSMIRPGSIDQHINLAPGGFHLVDQIGDGHGIGHIAADGQCLTAAFHNATGGVLCVSVTGPIADGDIPLRRRQVKRNSTTDAFRPASNQRYLACHACSMMRAVMMLWSVIVWRSVEVRRRSAVRMIARSSASWRRRYWRR